MDLKFEDGSTINVRSEKEGKWMIDEQEFTADLYPVSAREFHILYQGKSFRAFLESIDHKSKLVTVLINGQRIVLKAKGRYEDLLESLGMTAMVSNKAKDLLAPMPGLVLDIAVTVGQEVLEGETLLVLEAMKMENVIKASGPGTVKDVLVSKSTSVEKGQVLIQFES